MNKTKIGATVALMIFSIIFVAGALASFPGSRVILLLISLNWTTRPTLSMLKTVSSA